MPASDAPLRPYECVLVLAPTLDEDAVLSLLARARQAIEQRGGLVLALERWGKRRLAYDIAHHSEAAYVLLRFQAPPVGGTAELEHLCRITEDVLRHMIVQAVEGGPARPDAKPDEAPVAEQAAPA